jgi:flagellar motor protein MotB
MRLTAITFDRYGSGVTDFSTVFTPGPQADLLNQVITIMAGLITNPPANQNVSIIVTGHSDRQDQADLSCDDRRASEITAATDRASSAWEWIKQQVSISVSQSGVQPGDWWETSPHITWGLVFAAAGMLKFDPPADEDQRSQNRRVVILVSIFNPE